MSESELVWISTAQLCPIPRHFCPDFGHFFCLKPGQKSQGTSLGHYNPRFPKQPSLVGPDFGQLGCPDFEHKSCNLMPEI